MFLFQLIHYLKIKKELFNHNWMINLKLIYQIFKKKLVIYKELILNMLEINYFKYWVNDLK